MEIQNSISVIKRRFKRLKKLPLILILFIFGFVSVMAYSNMDLQKSKLFFNDTDRYLRIGAYDIYITGNESKWVKDINITNGKVIIIPKELKDRTYTECIEWKCLKEDSKTFECLSKECIKTKSVVYNIPDSLPVKESFNDSAITKTTITPSIDPKTSKEYFSYTLNKEMVLKIGTSSIFLIKAVDVQHLYSNRTFMQNLTDVEFQDNNFSEWVNNSEYVRITFEKNLTKDNYIEVFAYSDNSVILDVYEKNSNIKLGSFNRVRNYQSYIFYLTDLNNSQDTFDIRVSNNYIQQWNNPNFSNESRILDFSNGSIKFDFIIDPLQARRMFTTASTYAPNIEISGFDSACASEATAFGYTGTWKALIVDSDGTRDWDYDWVFETGKNYYRPNGIKIATAIDNCTCTGTSNTCDAYTAGQSDCETMGCTWQLCSGDATPCSSYGDLSSCGIDAGCIDETTCSGEMSGVDCENILEESFCNVVSGCYWDTSSCYGDPVSLDCGQFSNNYTICNDWAYTYGCSASFYCGGTAAPCSDYNADYTACSDHYCTPWSSDCEGTQHSCDYFTGYQEGCSVSGNGCSQEGDCLGGAWFGFPLENYISSYTDYSWTGLTYSAPTWGKSDNDCNNWFDATSSYNGDTGASNEVGVASFYSTLVNCDDTQTLYCVEQSDYADDDSPPEINFTNPTPTNGTSTTNTSVELNITIDSGGNAVGNFSLIWNGTNYRLYDNRLLVMFNFDNVSSIGDSGTNAVNLAKDIMTNGTCNDMGSECNYSDGRYGKSIIFNGNNYITLSSLSPLNVFTISAWVKIIKTDTYNIIFSSNDLGGGNGIDLRMENSYFKLYSGGSTAGSFINSTATYSSANGWIHITATHDGTDATIYINGVKDKSEAQTIPNASYFDTPKIGVYSVSAPYGFNGSIDEVRIYNRSMTASEVKQLYSSNLARRTITHWDFYVNETNLAPGVYNYSATACDNLGTFPGNCNSTETRWLTITSGGDQDTTAPSINFTNPTPTNATYLHAPSTFINVSIDSTVTLKNASWNWNGTSLNIFGEDLVLMLNMDNKSSLGDATTKTVDVSGNALNGTCVNMGTNCNYTTGKYNSGIYFNGATQWMNVSANAKLSPVRITVSSWIKTTMAGDGMFVKRYLLSGAYPGYAQRIISGVAYTWMGGGSWVYSTRLVNDGTWHNIVSTCNGTQITLYIDGVQDGVPVIAACNVSAPVGETLYIGSYTGAALSYAGVLDEIRIYNRSFSASEVQQLYSLNLAKFNSTHYDLSVNKTNFVDSTVNYYASACDVNGLCNSTETRTLFPDVAPPILNFVSPTPENNGVALANTSINMTANENLSSCYLFTDINFSTNLGDGSDGVLMVTGTSIVNTYTYLLFNETTADNMITLNNSAGFSAGDEILIIQTQNFSGGFAGGYEFRKIVSISGTNLTLDANPTRNYFSNRFNAVNSTSAQVIRVPQYTLVNINQGGVLTASAWDGYQGGIIVFRTKGTVNVGSGGSITATGKGFRGGDGINALNTPGNQGESFIGIGISSTSNNLGGGGGGRSHHLYWIYRGTGGGAGGYTTAGESGTSAVGSYIPTTNIPGTGGTGYGTANLSLILFGSGGGGTWDGYAYGNRVGGSGGGIIMLFADNITVSGSIISSGNVGADNFYGRMGGAGGGSGGSILLIGNKVSIGTSITVAGGGVGGLGFFNSAADHSGNGGNGSVGRIAVYNLTSTSGTTSPTVGFYGDSNLNSYAYNMQINNNDALTTANYTLTNLVAGSNITISAVCGDTIPNWNQTDSRNFSIVPDTGASTCTYSGSGNWIIDWGENCSITTNYNLGGNNLTVTNVTNYGTVTLLANITNVKNIFLYGMSGTNKFYCMGGNCIH